MNELQEIKISMAALTEKVTGFMNTTTEYRVSLCDKLKDVTNKLNGLPCGERKGWYVSMGKQVAFMWAVLAILIAALFGSYAAAANDRAALKKEVKDLICSKRGCEK